MKKRLIGGSIFVVFVVGAFMLRNISLIFFDLFVVLLMVLGAIEMSNALKDYLNKKNLVFIYSFIALIIPSYYLLGGMTAIYKLFFVYFWIIAVSSIYDRGYGIQNLACSALIGIYPIMLFSFMIEINHWNVFGLTALLLIFFTGPCCDVFAYLVGRTLKGPKLAPTISPNKTVSGAIGGVFGGVLGSIIVYYVSIYLFKIDLGINYGHVFFLVYGVIGSILTEFGDLVESSIKRSLNIKDMGNILPGHGGILDRFDGVLFVTFATYIYFNVLFVYG